VEIQVLNEDTDQHREKLLTVTELCETIQTTRRNVELLRKIGLPYYALSPGGRPRFDLNEVKEWMRKNAVNG
jgi:excisionase family DNA binding protein